MFFSGVKFEGQYYEIFINPTKDEVKECLNKNTNKAFRSFISNNDDLYIWNANIIHRNFIPLTKHKINPYSLRIEININEKAVNIDANLEHSFDEIICTLKRFSKTLDNLFGMSNFKQLDIMQTSDYPNGKDYKNLSFDIIFN